MSYQSKVLPVTKGGTGLSSTTINQILYSSATSTIAGLATANNSVLITGATGVPSLTTTLANSFSLAASSSGASVTMTVSNTSNTASSNALDQLTVAGTSAGDAFTTYTVSGTTNWSLGVDNSVTGDPFVIAASAALGTTNIMSAATTGEINYPLQPSFLAKQTANISNQTGDGTVYTVIFDSETYDQNGDYDPSTGIFTAPVTGKYLFHATILVTNIGAQTGGEINLVTTAATFRSNLNNPNAAGPTGNLLSYSVSTICNMTSGDTAKINIILSGSTKTCGVFPSADVNFFSGHLLC